MFTARVFGIGVLAALSLSGGRMLADVAEPLAYGTGVRVAAALPRLGAVAPAAPPPPRKAAEPLRAPEPAVDAEPAKTLARRKGRTILDAPELATRVVSAGAVLEIARAGLRPSGRTVSATAVHPPGIAVSGVGRLGLGVDDGDVLTRVDGAPVSDSGDVVALVVAALGRGQRSMQATLYRGEHPYQLVVHLPLLAEHEPAPPRAALGPAAPRSSQDRGELAGAAVVAGRSGVNAAVRGR